MGCFEIPKQNLAALNATLRTLIFSSKDRSVSVPSNLLYMDNRNQIPKPPFPSLDALLSSNRNAKVITRNPNKQVSHIN